MSTSTDNLSKQPSRRTAIVAMFLGLGVAVFTVVAEQHEASAPSASTAEASTAEVAREILEIQNQLGGSIVKSLVEEDSRPLVGGNSWLAPTPSPASAPVAALREAAWQVVVAAHRLELADLYSQADALRELASQLRHDARNMKREAEKTE
jgi:hypothetical protein